LGQSGASSRVEKQVFCLHRFGHSAHDNEYTGS
jgi:hypothetical protein